MECPKCLLDMESTDKGYKCKCGFSATTDYLVGYWDGVIENTCLENTKQQAKSSVTDANKKR